jgi:hypothetical protein
MENPDQPLTQIDYGMTSADMETAERIARALGYKQTAYTSTSALYGLFCIPENPASPGRYTGGCIIKTREIGFLFVADGEDLGLGHNWTRAAARGLVGECVNHPCSRFEYPVPAADEDARCDECGQLLCHESGLTWADAREKKYATAFPVPA